MASTTSVDEGDRWSESDASREAESIPASLQPRAYQIEMFEESMKQNTIVTVSMCSNLTAIVLSRNRWKPAAARR